MSVQDLLNTLTGLDPNAQVVILTPDVEDDIMLDICQVAQNPTGAQGNIVYVFTQNV